MQDDVHHETGMRQSGRHPEQLELRVSRKILADVLRVLSETDVQSLKTVRRDIHRLAAIKAKPFDSQPALFDANFDT